jgi:hypothetical protein
LRHRRRSQYGSGTRNEGQVRKCEHNKYGKGWTGKRNKYGKGCRNDRQVSKCKQMRAILTKDTGIWKVEGLVGKVA